MVTVCGSASGFAHGDCLKEARFNTPYAICIDAAHPLNLFIGDKSSIRYVDTVSDTVSLVAGDSVCDNEDGVGSAARFNWVCGLLCTSSGDRLFVADSGNNLIRMVDTKTRAVMTIAGNTKPKSEDGVGLNCSIHDPHKLVFDRSPNVEPESIIYISADNSIRRFNLKTSHMSTCAWKTSAASNKIDPFGLCCTPTGHLLFACPNTNAVYAFDPPSGELELLAGSGHTGMEPCVDGPGRTARFMFVFDMTVVEHERCAYVVDHTANRLRRMTLPSYLFLPI